MARVERSPSDTQRWKVAGRLVALVMVVILAWLPRRSAPTLPWRVYVSVDGDFSVAPYPRASSSPCPPPSPPSPPLAPPPSPSTWQITDSALADATNDGALEWVLLVWRPWQDWPIQRWSSVPSPLTDFHDAAGDSCHVILLDPQDGREIWAGSALPTPLLALEVGDVDGDGRNELVTLEGDYSAGREVPASHVDVWRWNGFGFTLEWRSPAGRFRQFCLTDAGNGSILSIAVR